MRGGAWRALRSPQTLLAPFSSRQWVQRRSYAAAVNAGDLKFGQPLHETHPHLLGAGEVTPGITALEYYERRRRLAQALPKNSCAILAASPVQWRTTSVFHPFHQDSDFFYLTGFNEPDALALIEKTGGEGDGDHVFHLWVRRKNPHEELWDGARSGVQAAEDVFNADVASPIQNAVADDVGTDISRAKSDITRILARLQGTVFTDLPTSRYPKTPFERYVSGLPMIGHSDAPEYGILSSLKVATNSSGRSISLDRRALRPFMNELRLIKSEAEVRNMRKAGQASGRAFTEAMRNAFSGERELGAFLDYRFKVQGCDDAAYVPVIAGGENALSIHYTRNDDRFKGNELVLVDAGGEFGGYVTDITRTWPVSGKFTPAQRDLYTMILSVQRSCVSMCREDSGMTLDKLHKISETRLKDGLQSLGFDVSGNAMETLYPHHLGHYVGLDVHDSPGYPRNRPLKEGMCITIEPGIYVPMNDDARFPKHFKGMGIRIEDSICVQTETPFILTTEAVKEVDDIEALRD